MWRRAGSSTENGERCQRKGKCGKRGKNTHLEPVGFICQAENIDSVLESTWSRDLLNYFENSQMLHQVISIT